MKIFMSSLKHTHGPALRLSEELAKEMAQLAHLLNDVMFLAYQQEDKTGKLHRQLDSFRQILINTLTPKQFTDMVAQTICYGLFAAISSTLAGETGGSHDSPPRNLCNLRFNPLAEIELDDRLVWVIDKLVAVLNRADMSTILADFGKRTRQADPVVHFYEMFLAHYDANLREVRGVYYTPEPVVSYIVRSVDSILKDKFGLKQGLADPTQLENNLHKVQILDPATGTGTFLSAVVAKIYEQFRHHQGKWSDYVSKHLLPRLHGFELLMAPYTIAHMKLSLQLQATGYDFSGEERLQVFLTNTLDEPHHSETTWLAIRLSDEAKAASGIKQHSPVMVILGNPPYSYDSRNKGDWISQLIRDYYQIDGQPLKERNPKGLQDDYVKFIRFAQWRIQQTGYGVLGFVTNHGYLDNPTFRGMRQSLMQEFDEIYVLDLHGNSKKKEKSPDGTVDQNVFDIQQGVAIGFFVKHQSKDLTGFRNLSGLAKVHHAHLYGEGVATGIFVKHQTKEDLTGFRNLSGLATVYHAHLYGTRAFKYQYLMDNDINTTQWTTLQPQSPFYLFVPQDVDLLAEYEPGWKVTEMMPVNSVGIVTGQDKETIAFDYETANKLAQKHNLAETVIKPILYRPFDKRYVVYHEQVVTRPRFEVMQHLLLGENLGLAIGRAGQVIGNKEWDIIFCSKAITDMNLYRRGGNNLFPLYCYPTEKTGLFTSSKSNTARKPNFAEDFINDLETRLNLQWIPEGHGDFEKTVSALDVFNYMYAVFHSPTYRQRYAEFLKMDFPRLPLTSDKMLFKQLAELGGQLVKINLLEAEIENDCSFPIKGDNLVSKVAYQNEQVYLNPTQYFDHVKSEVWEFHLGGYQVCEKWLKDRKGRVLSVDNCSQYLYILAAIQRTRELMERIDEVIPSFPIL
jgi:predicted helicase